MTDPTSSTIPAGWYPDPAGGARSRWWDGTQWTAHFQEPYTGVGAVAADLVAPAGTKPYTVWIWLILAVMLLQLIPTLTVNYDEILRESMAAQNSTSLLPTYTTADLITLLVQWVGVALQVLFAFFDWRALKARGVPRPFHWAWSFFAVITPLPYVIARSVVVRRRTGSGIAPMWIGIAITVLGFVVSFAVVIPATVRMVDELMRTGGY